jgi:hypothetical protein
MILCIYSVLSVYDMFNVLILRCYKTHTWYPACPKGAKYIVIYREPCAAFYSLFNFLKGWMFQPGEVTLSEFVTDFVLNQGVPPENNKRLLASYFDHLVSWWEHRYAIKMRHSLTLRRLCYLKQSLQGLF